MLSCTDCRFYYENEAAGAIECRRNPPVMLEGTTRAAWPDIDKEEHPWCGEWQASATKVERDKSSIQRLTERDEQNRDYMRQAVLEDLGF